MLPLLLPLLMQWTGGSKAHLRELGCGGLARGLVLCDGARQVGVRSRQRIGERDDLRRGGESSRQRRVQEGRHEKGIASSAAAAPGTRQEGASPPIIDHHPPPHLDAQRRDL